MNADTILKTDVHQELSFFDKNVKMLIDLTVEYTPKIVMAALVLVLGFWLIKKLARISERAMVRRDLDVSLRTFLRSLIGVGLKILLMITVAGMIGIQTTSLVTVLGAAGLAVGLALQGSLSNFAGGVLVLVFKPFKVGDTIEALGQKGLVQEIQIFNTILITADNKTIILPNGSVSNNIIVNQSREGTLRGTCAVNISNEFDSDMVKKIILDVVLKDKRVLLDNHAPSVGCTKAGGGTYTLQASFFTSEKDNPATTASITENINKELANKQIGEPTPKMIVQQV
ncbi:MAG TPA: mechanosensitive ion channel domain-containing protein [Bacteroidia bacterium]|nr:mechanosensitive ion channel domain-containing protein [Bacteroidia bacterium]